MAKQKLTPPAQRKPKAPANRSVVPIPDTIESVAGYPDKLVIFRVPASPYWWVRYYDGKHIKRSTKTATKRDAIAFAKKFYEQLVFNKLHSITTPTQKSSFVTCAEEVIAQDLLKVQRKELSETYVKNAKTIIEGPIKKFFSSYNVTDINYQILDQFRTELTQKNLTASSIKIYISHVKKILDHAQRMGHINTTPITPKIKAADNPRDYFKPLEYRAIRTAARKLIASKTEVMQNIERGDITTTKKLRNIVISDQMHLLIGFMVYTFIRPTDLKQIKHKHIDIRKGTEGEYLFMSLPPSKKHSKPITSMPRAAKFYKALRALRLGELADYKADISDEYVFSPTLLNRAYAYKTIARQFDVILQYTNTKENSEGDTRTLYSLRHTSIMYRVMFGGDIDALKLANNARTSVEMLQRFYTSRLESHQFTSDLHAKKPGQTEKRQRKIFTTAPQPINQDLKIAPPANTHSPSVKLVDGTLKVNK
ncbi:MAG: phage integrase SAM-like domain-containing protein [Cytophagales bacterium]